LRAEGVKVPKLCYLERSFLDNRDFEGVPLVGVEIVVVLLKSGFGLLVGE